MQLCIVFVWMVKSSYIHQNKSQKQVWQEGENVCCIFGDSVSHLTNGVPVHFSLGEEINQEQWKYLLILIHLKMSNTGHY